MVRLDSANDIKGKLWISRDHDKYSDYMVCPNEPAARDADYNEWWWEPDDDHLNFSETEFEEVFPNIQLKPGDACLFDFDTNETVRYYESYWYE